MTHPPKKAFFNWSSGKDSALALYELLQSDDFEIRALLTNVNSEFSRVSMHGLRESLLDAQVASIGIPLHKLYFPADVTMEVYDQKMREQLSQFKQQGYEHAVFGDIFLEDLRAYRDQKLAEIAIKGVYPLWKRDTRDLLETFLNLGFKAITVSVNARLLGEEFVGRVIDQSFIDDLPDRVDVCGENGEFHTFVYDGPIFKQAIDFTIGEKVLKSYTLKDDEDDNCFKHQDTDDGEPKIYDTSFWYCDLIPR